MKISRKNAGILAAAGCAMCLCPAPTPASQGAQPKPVVIDQPTAAARTNQGIVTIEVTPDSIATIRVAPGVITRVALPEQAKTAVCGDLFDATTNTGSFIINNDGKDVFIKPVSSKGASNLFIKTEANVYAFDLVVVPVAQAFRVVNVNQPSYRDRIEAERKKALDEVEAQRKQLEASIQEQLDARRRDLERQEAEDLANERKKLRADADRRAGELASRRLAEGVIQGLNGVALAQRRGQFGDVTVELGASAYTFEGKLYVPYKVVNAGADDVVYREPRVEVRGPGDEDVKPVEAATFTSKGEFRVDANDSTQGVVIFERPALETGERLMFVLRAAGNANRVVQLRLL
jgi:hypothetical protein